MSEATARLVAVCLLAAIAVSCLLAYQVFFRLPRRRRRQVSERLAPLGFQPVANEALVLRLHEHLHHERWNRPSSTLCLARRESVRTVYVLDLEWGDEGYRNWRGAVVVESPRLALPRFTLLPKIPTAPADDADNVILANHAAVDRRLVALDRWPELERRYVLGASDPDPVERLFARGTFAWLGETDGVMASGEDRLLVVWPSLAWQVFVADPQRRTIEQRLELADALFDRLAGARPD